MTVGGRTPEGPGGRYGWWERGSCGFSRGVVRLLPYCFPNSSVEHLGTGCLPRDGVRGFIFLLCLLDRRKTHSPSDTHSLLKEQRSWFETKPGYSVRQGVAPLPSVGVKGLNKRGSKSTRNTRWLQGQRNSWDYLPRHSDWTVQGL